MLSMSARLRWIEHGGLADFDDMLRPAYARSGIRRHNLAGDKPIEQHADGGQALLGGRRAAAAGERLDIGANMQRCDVDDRCEAALLAPGEEFADRPAIGAARMRVADVGDEKFPKARLRAFTGRADKRS
jgi:hypothetical protein